MPEGSGGAMKTPREIAMDLAEADNWNSIESRFRNDTGFINEALDKYSSKVWNNITDEQRRVRSTAKIGVSQDGHRLYMIKDTYEDDKEIVTAAVTNNGGALAYATDRLKDDIDVVKAAIKEIANAGEYASERLKTVRENVLELVKASGCFLKYTTDELKEDVEIVTEAINQSGQALPYANSDVLTLEMCKTAIRDYPIVMGSIPTRLRTHPDIMWLTHITATDEKIDEISLSVKFRIERML